MFNDNNLIMALNTFKGKLTNQEVAQAHNLKFVEAKEV